MWVLWLGRLQFWSGNTPANGGVATNAMLTLWHSGEPNNGAPREDYSAFVCLVVLLSALFIGRITEWLPI